MKEKDRTADRAVQFAPFAALRGYEELISEKQDVGEERRELAEEQIAVISARLSRLSRGMRVRVVYYKIDRYVTLDGEVSAVDEYTQTLRLGREVIDFRDILRIRRL